MLKCYKQLTLQLVQAFSISWLLNARNAMYLKTLYGYSKIITPLFLLTGPTNMYTGLTKFPFFFSPLAKTLWTANATQRQTLITGMCIFLKLI